MAKSPDAFRTISEVSEWLDTPAHVLRFWESRFTQVKPVKRAGGRRYYRPNDMMLLGGIKQLLHGDGVTIRGVQKILREQGIKHVSGLSPSLEDVATSTTAAPEKADEIIENVAEVLDAEPATANVIPLREVKAEIIEDQPDDITDSVETLTEILSDPPPQDIEAPQELEPEDLMLDFGDQGENLFEANSIKDDETGVEIVEQAPPETVEADEVEEDKKFFVFNDDFGATSDTETATPEATPPARDVPAFLTGSAKSRQDILAQAASPSVTTDSLKTGKYKFRVDANRDKIGELYVRLKNLRDRVAADG